MKDICRLLFLVFFALLTTFQFSCKKNSEPKHNTIPEEVKSYYLFQPGSYWIYHNTKTNYIDCTYINSPPEFYQTKFILDDGRTVYSITDHYNINFEGHIFHTCAIDPDVVSFGYFMAYNAGIPMGEARHYYDNYFFENLNFYDSLPLSNQYFFRVKETKDSHLPDQGTPYIWAMSFLSAKNIGLIQTTLTISNNDSTWNLIRYHVVQ
jgi:hypothetical protein